MPHLSLEPIVLASGSRTRLAMLEAAGLEVVAKPAPVDEDEVKRSCRADGFTSAQVAEALAELKAMRVARNLGPVHTIGADQMLECEGEWFDKPADRAAARAQLLRLSGRTHKLISAVVMVHNGVRIWHHVASASLTMRSLGEDFVDRYLDAVGDAALTSVGAYQIEGMGAQLFSRVLGEHSTILGLPLLPLLDQLRVRGVLPA
ncbi:MAG TPA: Maf family protein [Azospirillaceae bacterium]|nr:Maf family protein [Azospirillaceae bacterium]